MGRRAIESTAPIARPSGGLPSLGGGVGQALQGAGGQLQQTGARLARADAQIAKARMRAQANAEALTLRGQLLELTDQINTTADPAEAEAQFIAESANISQVFADRGLPAPVMERALADFNAFAQTQRFKVRAAARTRNIDLGRAATFEGLDAATQQFAEAENDLDRATARQGYDTQLAIAEESRFFDAERLEKLKQSTEIDLQTARVAHLINTGRARQALSGLNDGSIDLPPEERLRERVRAAQAVESEHTDAAAALKTTRAENHIGFLRRIAIAQITGEPVDISAAEIRDTELDGSQFQEIVKGFNNPVSIFGSRDRVSDPETVARLWTLVGENVLTNAQVAAERLGLSSTDFVLLNREATIITESGGVAQEFDARQGIKQINAAYGVIGDQPFAKLQLNAEDALSLNRDVISYVRQINDARREGKTIDNFALADQIASRALNRTTLPQIVRALANFDMPPVKEWTFEVLDKDVRMQIEIAEARGKITSFDLQRAKNNLSKALLIVQEHPELLR